MFIRYCTNLVMMLGVLALIASLLVFGIYMARYYHIKSYFKSGIIYNCIATTSFDNIVNLKLTKKGMLDNIISYKRINIRECKIKNIY